jgi:hypothetical protein
MTVLIILAALVVGLPLWMVLVAWRCAPKGKRDRSNSLRRRFEIPSIPSRMRSRPTGSLRQLYALKQHYTGKLRLSDVRKMFEQMRDHA